MTAADLKAAEAAAAEAWAIVRAITDECLHLVEVNRLQRAALIAQGANADPTVRAIVIAVSAILERISAIADDAFEAGGVSREPS